MPDNEANSRLSLILGEAALNAIQDATVFLCGVGGVGSWTAEALVRGGVRHLVLMDPDTVKPSNLNRQLCALNSTIGQLKVNVLRQRLLDIAPDASIIALPQRLQPQEPPELLRQYGVTCVVDAIDERPPKLALIQACLDMGISIVSSMGAANKLRPELVQCADISDTMGCPLARIVRKNLRKMGIEKGVRVVFSPELPNDDCLGDEPENQGEKRPIGTISYMPAIFGLHCAAESLRLIRTRPTTKDSRHD